MDVGQRGIFHRGTARRRREGTRLFRLPHKWALEFIHRKNYRKDWTNELKEEYTFFTYQDYRREFARLGMRMVFSAPYSNPWVVKNCFKGRFQLYSESYRRSARSSMATNHFLVSQKVADKQSLLLEERRPSQKAVGDLQIMVVRDKKSGHLHELVKRPGEYCDIVPYRITADNRLVLYVRGGYPRPIVNAAQRGSHNLDGKKWSGHLIEPITMDTVKHDRRGGGEPRQGDLRIHERHYASLRLEGRSESCVAVGQTYLLSLARPHRRGDRARVHRGREPAEADVAHQGRQGSQLHRDRHHHRARRRGHHSRLASGPAGAGAAPRA